MQKILAFLLCLSSSVLSAGDLIIMSKPENIILKGHEHIDQRILKELYSAAMGFSVEQSSSWSGMYLKSPFELSEAIVTIVIDGISDIGLEIGHVFPMHTDENEESTYNALESRIISRYPSETSNVVRIEMREGVKNARSHKIFAAVERSDVSSKFLNRRVDEDNELLDELGLLDGLSKVVKLTKFKNAPHVFWFVISGLHAVSDLHGENSTQVREAKQILTEHLVELNDAFKEAFGNRVLVSVISSDASHTRLTRSLLSVNDNITDYNLAKVYSQDYPVIFNMILWFTVAMILALLATSLVIGGMDPGRDSIIYRMTSNRMKKDN